jgi:hypothetical protein
MNKDSNQFHLCLFNLEIQSECTISIKDYRTVSDQISTKYHQSARLHVLYKFKISVAHVNKLWQTLDSDKVCQEIKNKRACYQCQSN